MSQRWVLLPFPGAAPCAGSVTRAAEAAALRGAGTGTPAGGMAGCGRHQAQGSDPAQGRAGAAGALGSPALTEEANISAKRLRGVDLPARLWWWPPASGGWAGIILEMSAQRQPAGARQDAAGGGDSACWRWLPF